MPSEALATINLIHDLSIKNVEQIKSNILEVMANEQTIRLDFSSVNSLDISGFQLLVSLMMEEKKSEFEVTFIGTFNEGFKEELNRIVFPSNTLNNGEELYSFVKGLL